MELIVTADDFGYSPLRDDTIINSFKQGILTGTSLLVNGLSAESAVEKGGKVGLCIGLHLNISEGIPISDPLSIPSLVLEMNGMFVFRGKEGFIQAEKEGLINPKDVEKEFRAQIERFIQLTGKVPPYFDGHQHVHIYPRLATSIATICEEYGIAKTRFPSEDMDEVGWMNDNPRKPFRQTIYYNTVQSIPIYNEHHVYGGYGIGSSISGQTMSVQRILNCCLRYPRCEGSVTTLELMTHPGVPEETPSQWGCGLGCDAFSQSPDRVHEYQVLTDDHIREYLHDKGITLCSYETSSIGPEFPIENKKKRIVMMLSMKEGTGNTITGIRIAHHLMQLGFCVQMVDTTDCFEQSNIQAILHNCNYNKQSHLYCLVCIHAVRSGVFAVNLGVPYVVILGGTDINVNVNDPAKRSKITHVLSNAAHIVAFTEDMKSRTEAILAGSTAVPITVIPQSTETPLCMTRELRTALSLPDETTLVLLPAGIRPVKDICFVLDAFSRYHQDHPDCVLCVMGPVLDTQYADQVFKRLPASAIHSLPENYPVAPEEKTDCVQGVHFMRPIPHSRFMNAMMDADIILNTSISEGLPAVVLEAWSAEKVVLARGNSGCKAIICHEKNGLLFDTPEEFVCQLNRLHENDEYRIKLGKESKKYADDLNLFENERSLLKLVLESL